jgi:hypothetical protein
LDAHHRAYQHPGWLARAAFLWAAQPEADALRSEHLALAATMEAGDADRPLRVLVNHLRSCGHDVIIANLTTVDVAATGLHVVRALVHGLIPLAVGTTMRLGGPRLWDAPAAMGLARDLMSEARLNHTPHCFP